MEYGKSSISFLKLNFTPLDLNLFEIKGNPFERYGPENAKLTCFEIKNLSYFLNAHKNKFSFKIRPEYAFYTEIDGYGIVDPHIDPFVSASLNYYIEPVDCLTTFYKLKNSEAIPGKSVQEIDTNLQTRKESTAISYRLEDLEINSSFIALPHEFYLLNVKEIHSVTKPNTSVRKFISYRWSSYSFTEVANSLNDFLL